MYPERFVPCSPVDKRWFLAVLLHFLLNLFQLVMRVYQQDVPRRVTRFRHSGLIFKLVVTLLLLFLGVLFKMIQHFLKPLKVKIDSTDTKR